MAHLTPGPASSSGGAAGIGTGETSSVPAISTKSPIGPPLLDTRKSSVLTLSAKSAQFPIEKVTHVWIALLDVPVETPLSTIAPRRSTVANRRRIDAVEVLKPVSSKVVRTT
jgi:hypothetical protein